MSKRALELPLHRMVQVVVFLFAAFGGFLKAVAPPDEAWPRFAVGAASFLTLCVLLYIAALSEGRPRRRHRPRWMAAATVALVATLALVISYGAIRDRYTFEDPANGSEVFIRGTELTKQAKAYQALKPNDSLADLVAAFRGVAVRTNVWTPASIRRAKLALTGAYVALVLSIAVTIFCLTEGALPNRGVSLIEDHTAGKRPADPAVPSASGP